MTREKNNKARIRETISPETTSLVVEIQGCENCGLWPDVKAKVRRSKPTLNYQCWHCGEEYSHELVEDGRGRLVLPSSVRRAYQSYSQ